MYSCLEIGATGSGADAVAELKNHLYCAIESLREQGLPDRDAFRAATKQIGDAAELAAEFSRIRTCSVTPSGRSEAMQLASVMIVQSLVWAAVMIFVASTLSGTTYGKPAPTCRSRSR